MKNHLLEFCQLANTAVHCRSQFRVEEFNVAIKELIYFHPGITLNKREIMWEIERADPSGKKSL